MRSMSLRGRSARGCAALVAVAGLGAASPVPVLSAVRAGAAVTTTTIAPVEIPNGMTIGGAVITAPNTATRRLDAYQAATFVQSWIASLFLPAKHEAIPAGVTAYRVDVTGNWGGGTDLESRPVFYASDGTTAWLATPDPATVPPTGAPKKLDFFVVSPRAIQGFAGTLKMVPVGGTDTSTTTPTAVVHDANKDSGGGSAWPWIAGVVGVGLIAGSLGWRRSRMRNG